MAARDAALRAAAVRAAAVRAAGPPAVAAAAPQVAADPGPRAPPAVRRYTVLSTIHALRGVASFQKISNGPELKLNWLIERKKCWPS